MSTNLNKDGIIYKSMNKHRIKNIRYCLTVLVVFVAYFFMFKPYITNVLFGSSPLDEAAFKKDAVTKTLSVQPNADGEITQLVNSRVLKGNSYWQDDKYEFSMKVSNVRNTGITYTTKNTSEVGVEGEGDLSAVVYVVEINGVRTIVFAYPHQNIKDGDTIEGIFAPIAPVVSYDLISNPEYAEGEYYQYMLDTRGIEMENEGFDIVVSVILACIFLFLVFKVVIQYINPLSTPTYRNLEKYGDIKTISDDVEDQLAKLGVTNIKKKKPVVTDDWIISEEPFKLKIAKNHAKPQDNSRYGSKF